MVSRALLEGVAVRKTMKKTTRKKEDFLTLFKKIPSGKSTKDFNGVFCHAPVLAEEKIRNSENPLKELTACCGLPYQEPFISVFQEGYNRFVEVLAIWHYGFRNAETIENIARADRKFRFADTVFNCGMFADYIFIDDDEDCERYPWYLYHDDDEDYDYDESVYEKARDEGNTQTCFTFAQTPWLYEKIKLLLKFFDEKTASEFIAEYLSHPKKIRVHNKKDFREVKTNIAFDAIIDLMNMFIDEALSKSIVPQIKRLGICQASYDFILDYYARSFDDADFDEIPPGETEISFSQEQKNLEWKCDGYEFLLPKTVGFAFKLGEKIFCPGNDALYFEIADLGRTVVYVKKGLTYKFLMLLDELQDGTFELASFASNPKGRALTKNDCKILNHWYQEKGIVGDIVSLHKLQDAFEFEK